MIKNNGVERKLAADSKYKSPGSTITRRRIDLLNSIYKTNINPSITVLNNNNNGIAKGTLVHSHFLRFKKLIVSVIGSIEQ